MRPGAGRSSYDSWREASLGIPGYPGIPGGSWKFRVTRWLRSSTIPRRFEAQAEAADAAELAGEPATEGDETDSRR